MKFGLKSTFYLHVLEETQAFVLEHLWLGLSTYQMMNKHKVQVKDMMENKVELSQNQLLNEKDIRNMVDKLAKETYNKHKNDAQSVWVWVIKNKNKVFFYQESGLQVERGFQASNMPFIIGIQTK